MSGTASPVKTVAKRFLAGVFRESGLEAATAPRPISVLVFHRVNDSIAPDGITVSSATFRALIAMLRKEFSILSFSELVGILRTRQNWPKRSVVITFDDGYEDNFTVAAPILLEFGVPAIFYITADAIGSTIQFPWDSHLPRLPWMTWDMVRQLHTAGFEIGSHTLTHCDLGTATGEAARREIFDSKSRLEFELGSPVVHFAYPFGGRDRLSPENAQLVREAGYQSCCSAYGGVVRPGDNAYAIQRFGVNKWYSNPEELRFEIVFARGGK